MSFDRLASNKHNFESNSTSCWLLYRHNIIIGNMVFQKNCARLVPDISKWGRLKGYG